MISILKKNMINYDIKFISFISNYYKKLFQN